MVPGHLLGHRSQVSVFVCVRFVCRGGLRARQHERAVGECAVWSGQGSPPFFSFLSCTCLLLSFDESHREHLLFFIHSPICVCVCGSSLFWSLFWWCQSMVYILAHPHQLSRDEKNKKRSSKAQDASRVSKHKPGLCVLGQCGCGQEMSVVAVAVPRPAPRPPRPQDLQPASGGARGCLVVFSAQCCAKKKKVSGAILCQCGKDTNPYDSTVTSQMHSSVSSTVHCQSSTLPATTKNIHTSRKPSIRWMKRTVWK